VSVLTQEIARLEQDERTNLSRENGKMKLANRILAGKDRTGKQKRK
jgi:hypothetical protein